MEGLTLADGRRRTVVRQTQEKNGRVAPKKIAEKESIQNKTGTILRGLVATGGPKRAPEGRARSSRSRFPRDLKGKVWVRRVGGKRWRPEANTLRINPAKSRS